MSKRDFEYWSCTRKVAFDTWSAAEAQCRMIIEADNYDPRGKGLHAYRCVFNDSHWHIGSLSKAGAQKKRRAERELTKSRLDARLIEPIQSIVGEDTDD